jgi:hypothetical protein
MRTVRLGATGAAVFELQRSLKRHGFPVSIDGEFGPQTDAAVGQFQLSNDLHSDRIVGPRTWEHLLKSQNQLASIDAENEARMDLIKASKHLEQPQRDVLFAAISDLGCQEDPFGSNEGPEINHLVTNNGQSYRDYWQIEQGPPLPWCAMAVSHWIRQGIKAQSWSNTPHGAWFGGVSQWREWAKENGCWSYDPSPGSVFIMGRHGSGSDASQSTRAGHCGLVVSARPITITTIEGNTGNRVATKERRNRDCVGFVEWWRAL